MLLPSDWLAVKSRDIHTGQKENRLTLKIFLTKSHPKRTYLC
jgi:hypothetical protein